MYKFTKKQVKEAVAESNGTYSDVARKLKVRSPVTARKFVNKYADVLEEFNKIADELCDSAQNRLIELMNSDDKHVSARVCEFILKNSPRSPFRDDNKEDVQSQLISLLDKMIGSAEGKSK